MTKPLNVGIIGYGFMGRTHSNAYRKVTQFLRSAVRARPQDDLRTGGEGGKAFADQWGYESYETDWRKVIDDKDIDVVDICVPNNYHAEIAIAAAQAGKMIICEKPLARNGAEAEPMVQAVEKAGVPNMVSFNYRRVPAVTLAKQLIDRAGWARSSTTARTSCRTGRSRPNCRRAAWARGGWTSRRPAPASRATCWPTASTRPCGTTARSRPSPP